MHPGQHLGQPVGADLGGQPVGDHPVRGVDRAHRLEPGVGDVEQLGAAVGRVVGVLGEPLVDQQVGDPLHALPGQPHRARDLGDALALGQHGAQDLPPRGGQPDRPGQLLRDGEELAVEPEAGQRRVGEQRLRRVGLGHEAAISSKKPSASWSAYSLDQLASTSSR